MSVGNTPLALSLGLRQPGEAEDARTPVRMEAKDVMERFKHLPPGYVYVGRGHQSHRLPVGSTDDRLNLHAEHVMTHLQSELHQLRDTVLMCDCPISVPCEADVLAGLVFEQTRPCPAAHPNPRK